MRRGAVNRTSPRLAAGRNARMKPRFAPRPSFAGAASMRIVLVEDDDRVREMAVAALRDAGFEVTQAAAREGPTDDAPPVDVRLPDLFDGVVNREPNLAPDLAETHLQLEAADPIRVLLVENNEPL